MSLKGFAVYCPAHERPRSGAAAGIWPGGDSVRRVRCLCDNTFRRSRNAREAMPGHERTNTTTSLRLIRALETRRVSIQIPGGKKADERDTITTRPLGTTNMGNHG